MTDNIINVKITVIKTDTLRVKVIESKQIIGELGKALGLEQDF